MEKTAWIVEDSPDIGEIISLILSHEGYRVRLFDNATDFLKNILIIDADILIFDIVLPDGNGMELGRAVKSLDESGKPPILLMSANRKPPVNEMKYIADDFISKPFNIEDLMYKINKLVA